jgi:hypothetical protein
MVILRFDPTGRSLLQPHKRRIEAKTGIEVKIFLLVNPASQGLADRLKIVDRDNGTNIYLIRFHYVRRECKFASSKAALLGPQEIERRARSHQSSAKN